RRPSLWMRTKKMVRRHRMAVMSVASALLIASVACGIAVVQRQHNQRLERAERSRLYTQDVRLASHLVQRSRLNEASELLARHFPEPGEADLRTFPWFHLWRVCQYRPAALPGHRDSAARVVYHVELSPQGDLMASCGEDGTVRLWELEAGRLVRTL